MLCLVQVVVERLRTEWKLDVSTGEMRVAYREVRK
jgi:translation elongation factor EF-G